MKVKLLKKARKRFSIIHMPEGYISDEGVHYNYNIFKLIDSKSHNWEKEIYAQCKSNELVSWQFAKDIFESEEKCLDYLKQYFINILRKEGHKQRKDDIIKSKIRKVWYSN